jgi:hypothetical protein
MVTNVRTNGCRASCCRRSSGCARRSLEDERIAVAEVSPTPFVRSRHLHDRASWCATQLPATSLLVRRRDEDHAAYRDRMEEEGAQEVASGV